MKKYIPLLLLSGTILGASSDDSALAHAGTADYTSEGEELFPPNYEDLVDEMAKIQKSQPHALSPAPGAFATISRTVWNVGATSASGVYALGAGMGALVGLSSSQEKEGVSLGAQFKIAIANRSTDTLKKLSESIEAQEIIFSSSQNDLSLFGFVCLQGDEELIKIFGENWPSMIDKLTLDQKTPLALILEKQDPATADVLLKLGANPNTANANELVARILAQERSTGISKEESKGRQLKALIMRHDALERGRAIEKVVEEHLKNGSFAPKKITTGGSICETQLP